MALVLDDKKLKKFNLNEQEFRIEMATHFYEIGKMSIGQATQFARLDRVSFQKELTKRKIRIRFTITDLHHDLKTIQSLDI